MNLLLVAVQRLKFSFLSPISFTIIIMKIMLITRKFPFAIIVDYGFALGIGIFLKYENTL